MAHANFEGLAEWVVRCVPEDLSVREAEVCASAPELTRLEVRGRLRAARAAGLVVGRRDGKHSVLAYRRAPPGGAEEPIYPEWAVPAAVQPPPGAARRVRGGSCVGEDDDGDDD